MTAPLAGIKVVEIANYVAVPAAATLPRLQEAQRRQHEQPN